MPNILDPFNNLNLPPTLAVAVSGGADSMALLLMADDYARAQKNKVVALTVDHGLRTESKNEAAQVAAWCAARGIEHHVLSLPPLRGEVRRGGKTGSTEQVSPPTPALPLKGGGKMTQDAARNLRYELLTDWCKKNRVDTLLTAHHLGDQAETLFFRLARGSGIFGLACMQAVSDCRGIRLIRPLLDVSKAELIRFLQAQNQPWIEDESNQNLAYTRNALRAELKALPNAEAIERRAGALAAAFARIRAALEEKTRTAFAQTAQLRGEMAVLDAAGFASLPPETARMVLARLVQELTGDDHPPRTRKLERLYKTLTSGKKTRATLAHVSFTVEPAKNRIAACPIEAKE